ncbi:Pseudouridine synthase II N-terminal domain-containing protein [Plasmodiophora brassicae]
MVAARTSLRPVPTSGFLPIYKAPGTLSADVCARVKRTLRRHGDYPSKLKVGHGGTLDYFAEGLLVLGIGPATKRLTSVLHGPKRYRCIATLGTSTDTLDPHGKVVETMPFEHVTKDAVQDALTRLTGTVWQVPPQYSALKIGGVRCSDRVRKGEAVDLPARQVEVHRLELVQFRLPDIHFDIRCGPGFYVRSFVRDLGAAVGSCAFTSHLCRMECGPFALPDPTVLNSNDVELQAILDSIRPLPEDAPCDTPL